MSQLDNPPCPDGNCPEDPSRRRFLQQATAGAAGLLLVSALPGCKPEDPEVRAGTRADLAERGILNPNLNEDRLHVTEVDGAPFALALTCSHKRCTVRWKAELSEFHCPCHRGVYDQTGKKVSGPPPSDLRRLKAEWRGDDLYVLNQDA
jgi:nitrite reductase/ring-hydroxylating ferredoxin subunit